MARKFYTTTFSITVISEGELGDCLTLTQIDEAITEGACLGGPLNAEQREITAKEAADHCVEFASDPSFFELDANGKDLREDY
jgi:hypothetical protein